jgi:prepilin-type N-terminal cleavage/methylation domain-containing protein
MTSARGSRRGRRRGPPPSESAPRHGARGYTLAELLAVIAIMAVLAGISLGVLATLPGRLSHETAATSVRALLRRARASAIESRAEATVRFAGRRVEAFAWAPLALLRMDDLAAGAPGALRTVGARGLEGRISGALPVEGRVGAALEFVAPGAHVDLGSMPLLDASLGLRIEAWVHAGDFAELRDPPPDSGARPRPPPPGGRADEPYLFQVAGKGGAYFLRVREDYALVGGVRGPGGPRAPLVTRETPPRAIAPHRWCEVGLLFDGRDFALYADGLRASLPGAEGERLPPSIGRDAAPLVISSADPGLSFHGAIDEVRVLGIDAEEGFEAGEDVEVVAPPLIRFDPRGALDPLYHDGPETVRVRRVVRSGASAGPGGGGMTAGRGDPARPSPAAPGGGDIAIVVERTGAVR